MLTGVYRCYSVQLYRGGQFDLTIYIMKATTGIYINFFFSINKKKMDVEKKDDYSSA
jgi:hypothetical protein